MPNYNQSQRESASVMRLGTRVDRDTANMTGALALFDIEGGNCLVTLIVGEVTSLIDTATIENQLYLDADTGADEVLCNVLDWSALEAGTLLTIHGNPSTAMQYGSSGFCKGPVNPIVVTPGAIDITVGLTHNGNVKWSLWYIPMEEGAYIEAT